MMKILAVLAAIVFAMPIEAQTRKPVRSAMPAVCRALPVEQVKDYRNEYPIIECGWEVPLGVSNGAMTGGFAGVQTDKTISVYNMSKETQQQLIQVYGKEPGATIKDQSGFLNCAESRMVVLSDKGIPSWSHFTALCDGIGISYVTVGPEYSTDDAGKFSQIVKMLVGDRSK